MGRRRRQCLKKNYGLRVAGGRRGHLCHAASATSPFAGKVDNYVHEAALGATFALKSVNFVRERCDAAGQDGGTAGRRHGCAGAWPQRGAPHNSKRGGPAKETAPRYATPQTVRDKNQPGWVVLLHGHDLRVGKALLSELLADTRKLRHLEVAVLCHDTRSRVSMLSSISALACSSWMTKFGMTASS